MSTSLSSKRLSLGVYLRRLPLINQLFVPFSLSLFSPSKNSTCDLAQYSSHSPVRDRHSTSQQVNPFEDPVDDPHAEADPSHESLAQSSSGGRLEVSSSIDDKGLTPGKQKVNPFDDLVTEA